MVMGRDSRSDGHRLESHHHILDGHCFTYICCIVCLKRSEINEKESGAGPLKNIYCFKVVAARNASMSFCWVKVRSVIEAQIL